MRGKGTTFQELSGDELARFPLAFPASDEQQIIVSFLDRETAKIDVLLAEQERLIALLNEKRQAVISHAVTKGLYPDVPMKPSGVEWLSEVPAHWQIRRIKFLVERVEGLQMGPFGGMLLNLSPTDTGFKVYGQENTISGDFERGSRWIDEERFMELSNYWLRPGDIVLTRKGSLGNARLVTALPSTGIIDSDTIRLRANRDKVLPAFLVWVLHEANYAEVQLALSKRGAILSGINSETVANLCVAVPPVSEQAVLLHCLEDWNHKFEAQATACHQAADLLRERRSALISAAVSGQIDVRNAA